MERDENFFDEFDPYELGPGVGEPWQLYGEADEAQPLRDRLRRETEQAVLDIIEQNGGDVDRFRVTLSDLPVERVFMDSEIQEIKKSLDQLEQTKTDKSDKDKVTEQEEIDNQKIKQEVINRQEIALYSRMSEVFWIGQFVEVLCAEDPRYAMGVMLGTKQEAQARIIIDQALSERWKTALIKMTDEMLEGPSLEDATEAERFMRVADAQMDEEIDAIMMERVYTAKNSLAKTLKRYEDYGDDFNFVVAFLAQVAVDRLMYRDEKLGVIIERADTVLQSMGLGFDHKFIKQALQIAQNVVMHKEK